MNRSLKIFLTCACGAGIGTLIALQLKQQYNLNFWALIIGMIFGGLTGYIFIEFKEFVKAIPQAWQMTRHLWQGMAKRFIHLYHILANREIYKTILYLVPAVVLVSANLFFLNIVFPVSKEGFFESPGWNLFLIITLIALFVTLLCVFFTVVIDQEYYFFTDDAKDICKKCIIYCNPIAVFIYWPLRGIWEELGKLVYLNWQIITTFFKNLFILTHSDWRLLCAIDCMIGVCIGFACGNAIIGALAGGIFGLANYELFSVRILKLVPARVKK